MKDLLDEAYERYARPDFVQNDPVQIPRSYTDPRDAEIMGFLTATITWGQRAATIASARKWAHLMDDSPHSFVMDATKQDLALLDRFVHRTFNGVDARQFVLSLRQLYHAHGGLEEAFLLDGQLTNMGEAITLFRARFFATRHAARTRKHVADPARGSQAKRINMFLRWMVRPDDRGIDLGLWKRMTCSALHVPLDVHTGRVARELGLLQRSSDDWKSVEELTNGLRAFDAQDPVKYDIALFGIGLDHSKASRATRSVPRSSTARRR